MDDRRSKSVDADADADAADDDAAEWRAASLCWQAHSAGVESLVAVDCGALHDVTRLRVSALGDATLDDWSARRVRRRDAAARASSPTAADAARK